MELEYAIPDTMWKLKDLSIHLKIMQRSHTYLLKRVYEKRGSIFCLFIWDRVLHSSSWPQTKTYYIVENDLKLLTILLQLPKCRDYGNVPLWTVYIILKTKPRTFCMKYKYSTNLALSLALICFFFLKHLWKADIILKQKQQKLFRTCF